MNSFSRSRPPSEEISPPEKLNFKDLLLWGATVDKLDIRALPSVVLFVWSLIILTGEVLFFYAKNSLIR